MSKLPSFPIARLWLVVALLLAVNPLNTLAQTAVKLTDVRTNPAPGTKFVDEKTLTLLNDKLYFRAITSAGDPTYHPPWQPFVSDGTPEGTKSLTRAFINADVNFTEYNGKVYFIVPYVDVAPRQALYVSDGTEAGTTLVKTFLGIFTTGYQGLLVANGKLYFVIENSDGSRHDLYVSDGTRAGTVLLKSLTGSDPTGFTASNGKLYFVAEGSPGSRVLWVTDGTEAGTKPLSEALGVSTGSTDPRELTNVGNKLFYVSGGAGGGYASLWVTDDTAPGTHLVVGGSYSPGPGTTLPFFIIAPSQLTAGPNNKLVFRASSARTEDEPWISDGTPEGTFSLDINPDVASFPTVSRGIVYNGRYYFTATLYRPDVNARGVFSTDGTEGSARFVVSTSGQTATNFTLFGGKLCFIAGSELWITDGTEATRLAGPFISSTIGGGTVALNQLVRADGKLYFLTVESTDGPSGTLTNKIGVLWESDGTVAGTRSLYPVDEVFRRVLPNSLRPLDNKLYFVAPKVLTSLTEEEGKDLFRLESGTTGKVLSLLPPTYDCESGKIVFNIRGGDGSTIKYDAPGVVRKSATDNFGIVDEKLRKDPKPILIQAYQNKETSKFLFDLPNACNEKKGGRLGAATELGSGLSVKILGNPVPGESVEVEIRGAEGQPLSVLVSDMQGHPTYQRRIGRAAEIETQIVRLGSNAGTYLLRVSSPQQKQTVKLLRQ